MKDVQLTPGLPKPTGRLYIESEQKDKESDSSVKESMRVIEEVVHISSTDEYVDSGLPILQKNQTVGYQY